VQHHYEGHWKGRALKIETFLGPEMARATVERGIDQIRQQQNTLSIYFLLNTHLNPVEEVVSVRSSLVISGADSMSLLLANIPLYNLPIVGSGSFLDVTAGFIEDKRMYIILSNIDILLLLSLQPSDNLFAFMYFISFLLQ
jgi:hypothetical protein